MFTRTRLAVATLAAATLPLAGFVLADVPHGFSLPGAAVAHAQTETSIPATGNLHIHKRLGLPESETPHDGTEVDTPPGDAVPGVGYTVYRVLDAEGEALDLTTQAGWAAAQGVTLGEVYANGAPVAARVGTGVPGTTGAGGTATFNDLAAGLYLVVEEDNPTDAEGNALAPAAPFLVTVPLTNPDGNGWLSDVHVYPKNQSIAGPVKTVTDPATAQPGASVGEQIGFQIDTTIPKITPGNTFNGFLVTDKLPAGLGEPEVTVTLGGAPLTAETDYTLTTYQVGDQWVVRVQLTGGTLSNLHTRSGQVLQVNPVSTVESVPAGGVLENTAWVLPNNPGAFPEGWDPANPGDGPNPGNKSNTTRSVYGAITINKTATDGTPLNGAIFELNRCTGNTVNTTDPIAVGGATDFTTATAGANAGQVVISGIHLANLQTGQDPVVTEDVWAGVGANFCLVETQAPDGYSLLPQPIPVTLTATGNETALVTATADIQNVETNAGFNLPLTGGRGIWALIGGGVLLLLLAAAYYMKTRRSTGSAD